MGLCSSKYRNNNDMYYADKYRDITSKEVNLPTSTSIIESNTLDKHNIKDQIKNHAEEHVEDNIKVQIKDQLEIQIDDNSVNYSDNSTNDYSNNVTDESTDESEYNAKNKLDDNITNVINKNNDNDIKYKKKIPEVFTFTCAYKYANGYKCNDVVSNNSLRCVVHYGCKMYKKY
jgi:hypothetical protein